MKYHYIAASAIILIGALTGCEEGGQRNSSQAPNMQSTTVDPERLLRSYVSENARGSYVVKDAYDGSVQYQMDFSNGSMRLVSNGTSMYEGPLRRYSDFDKSCIGGEKFLFGDRYGYYLCVAVNPITERAQSANGTKYQFSARSGDLFFESIGYDSQTDQFPGRKVARDMYGTFHGKVASR